MTVPDSAPPLYRYIHSFADNTSYSLGPTQEYGPTHGDEMFYIFNASNFGANYDIWSDAARVHSHRMCTLWTDFAKYGRPGEEVGWEEYGLKGESLFLGEEMKMGVDEEMEQRMAQWYLWMEEGC